MTVAVKICGITRIEDAEAAADAGADFIGLVFSASPRRVSLDLARTIVQVVSPVTRSVGVFVNESLEFVHATAAGCRLDAVQLQGTETVEYCVLCRWPVIKGIRLEGPLSAGQLDRYGVAAFLFDTHVPGLFGGTGRCFDWSWLQNFSDHPFVLAGGLDPDNVARAVSETRPYAVDVSSGVARSARFKDPAKMRAFVANAKSAPWQGGRDWTTPFFTRKPSAGNDQKIC